MSEIDICNRALQKLGAERITSLTQENDNARECNIAYANVRDAELRAHPWNFAIKREQLAADATAPAFGYDNQFTLPSDFLRLLPIDSSVNYNTIDYKIEGGKILTDEDAPLNIRYVARITDTNKFDALFTEALADRVAIALCEKLTQSNTKAQMVREDYVRTVREAKRINAFENVSAEPPTDTWITSRE